MITKQATLVDFFSYEDCKLRDLPRLALELKKQGKNILWIAARRRCDNER